jgi:NADH:ubiquinone oxidoreductase subunit C
MHEAEINKLVEAIESEIGEPCQHIERIYNEWVFEIPSKQLRKVVNILIDRHEVQHLSTITAQINKDDPNHMQVLYHFWKGTGISLLISLEMQNPVLDSVVDMLPGADFYEREVAEMYGIHFDLREHTPPLLLPENWNEGPPMLTEKEEN